MCRNWICMCVHAKIVWFCWIQRTNCVVGSELGVRCRIEYSAMNQMFVAELSILQRIRCSLPNLCCPQGIRCLLPNLCCPQRIRCLLPNLCCPQRIRFLLPNCVVRIESSARCRIVLSAINQVFAAELCCRSKSSVHCWIDVVAANQVFTVELCCPQRIKCSPSNCVVRRESGVGCWIFVVHSESGFHCWIMLFVANLYVVYSGSVIHWRNRVACSELVFFTKSVDGGWIVWWTR